MPFETSLVRYDSIELNNTEVALDGAYKVSFSPPYNKINLTFSLVESSLSYYEVRVTREADPYDIGVGTLARTPSGEAIALSNLALNKSHTITIAICPETFNSGDGDYRVSLYAKSALDGMWDVTYLLFTLKDSCYLQTSDGSILGVGTSQDIP